jgi:hypothetical protein
MQTIGKDFTKSFGYSEKLPESTRLEFMWLCQDVASLYNQWDLYIGLFGSEENNQLLSEVSIRAFNVIAESLEHCMAMGISRLNDPAQSNGYKNLSFRAMLEEFSNVDGLQACVDDFNKLCEPIEKLRNKKIGHRDRTVTLEPEKYPIPGMTRSQVSNIFEKALDILNLILREYSDGELSCGVKGHSGYNAIIYLLKKGKEAESSISSYLGKT